MSFSDLGIIKPILKALKGKGYTQPTPIQEQAIPILLGRNDLLGCAQTGTGKTAAFAIPILQHLAKDKNPNDRRPKIKALVVTPTRELAIQIAENFTVYASHTQISNTVIFGGVKQGSQTRRLNKGVDVLVATPGRLLDLIGQGFITLKHIEYFVLDEADQMLDMGFIHDIKKIIKMLPANRQSLFFSATLPENIVKLSRQILGNPQKITIKPEQATAEKVEQALYYVSKKDKVNLLIHLVKKNKGSSVLVFSRTKYGADKIVKKLHRAGIEVAAIHGNKSQNARQRALKAFKDGEIQVLIATDIAARGIDVSALELVINYDLPNVAETYVHRIGRTGRAKASGVALSFCTVDEKPNLKGIEKLIRQTIPVIEDHPFPDLNEDPPAEAKTKPKPKQKSKKKRPNNQQRQQRTASGTSQGKTKSGTGGRSTTKSDANATNKSGTKPRRKFKRRPGKSGGNNTSRNATGNSAGNAIGNRRSRRSD